MEEKENLNDGYKYNGEGEIMSDISSSEPVNVVKNTKKKKKVVIEEPVEVEEQVETVAEVEPLIETFVEPVVVEPVVENTIKELSEKEMFKDMLDEDRHFTMKVGGTIIFDSEINNKLTVIFEDSYFIVGKQQYSYESLNFKFKK